MISSDKADRRLLSGVVPPIVTPLDKVGSLDVSSLERLVEFELSAGVSALFVLGTGGEGPYLDLPEREAVVIRVVEQVAGRVPVLVGVSDIGTARALRNLRMAVAAGADGLVSTAPFYGEAGDPEVEKHFGLLASAAGDVPLYAYDIPSKVGARLSTDVVLKLARSGVIAGIKDSSGDFDAFRRLRLELGGMEGFSLLTGSDSFADMALLGLADGMIAGMANVDPAGFVRLYAAASSGRWEDARAEQDRLFLLRDIVLAGLPRLGSFSATIGSFKTALVQLGVISSDSLQPPLCQLNDCERRQVHDVLMARGLSLSLGPGTDGGCDRCV